MDEVHKFVRLKGSEADGPGISAVPKSPVRKFFRCEEQWLPWRAARHNECGTRPRHRDVDHRAEQQEHDNLSQPAPHEASRTFCTTCAERKSCNALRKEEAHGGSPWASGF